MRRLVSTDKRETRPYCMLTGSRIFWKKFPAAFDGVKPLCRELRSIWFSLTRDGELDLATPANPNTLYNPFIKAFERLIVRLNRGTKGNAV